MYKMGDKVVPHTKTVPEYEGLETSGQWSEAKEINQPYLYVVGVGDEYEENPVLILSLDMEELEEGDYFFSSDVEFYKEWNIEFSKETDTYMWVESHRHSDLKIHLFEYKESEKEMCNAGFTYSVYCWGKRFELLNNFQPKQYEQVLSGENHFGIATNQLTEALELVENIKEHFGNELKYGK